MLSAGNRGLCYLELLVELAAVSVQHGQVKGPEVGIETAMHSDTCHSLRIIL